MRILGAIAFKVVLLLFLTSLSFSTNAQCTWYTITVTDGVGAPDVTWELIDDMGVSWASGSAPWSEDICLPNGCYTLLMYDSSSDGWDDINWFIEDWTGDFDWDTNLPDGPHGTDTFVLGDNQPCDPANGATCPPGSTMLQFIVTNGTAPAQVSWDFTWNGTVVQGGGAGYNDTLCLSDGCYVLYMQDAASNGWNGATYTLQEFGGTVLYSGTLTTGGLDSVLISIGGATCSWGGGPGPGPGGGCGTVVTSGQPGGDCPTVICVCDPFTFPITPSGFGAIDEIPAPGSVSNPAFGGGIPPPPWGGTDYGCLYAGELNSSWILFTVGTSGSLGFSFGAGGQQVGYYDWAMWPYSGPSTCSAIANDALPPVRCVWDAVPYGGAGLANVIPPGGDPGNYAPELMVTAGQQFIICMSNWSYVTANVTLDFFGSATISCIPVLLPVELISFTAYCRDNEVNLQWSTASERDNDHFAIERSADGYAWETIGWVPGAGNAQHTIQYSFSDAGVTDALNYYRLGQTDFDGTITYSSVVAVSPCGDKEVVRQWLVDARGRVQGEWPLQQIPLSTGIYLLRTEFTDGSTRTTKVAVQEQ
ncbi:MAG: hypothetical protein IPK99_07610 [Flavobacteriales bacterium]|nr:hypothetical protein [Flavobacteriales bacterium]